MTRNITVYSAAWVFISFLSLSSWAPAQSLRTDGAVKPEHNIAAAISRPAAPKPNAHENEYTIGPDDILAINVWKEADLSRSAVVRPDGRITLPLVGDLEATGLTPKQLQDTIQKRLGAYVSNPTVTVIVEAAKSHKFNIVGQVQKPNVYLLSNPTTVLDAIVIACGFREWAKIKNIYILRAAATGGREKLPFNYKKVIKGEAAEQNIQLRAGDTIVVP